MLSAPFTHRPGSQDSMPRIRSITTLVVAFAAIVGLTSCGSADTTAESSPVTAPPASVSTTAETLVDTTRAEPAPTEPADDTTTTTEPAPVPEVAPAGALLNTVYTCVDAQGDVAGELSGRGPSVPINAGDIAEATVDFSRDGLNVWTRTFPGSAWMGGPGDATLDIFLVLNGPDGTRYEAWLARWGGSGDEVVIDPVIPDPSVAVVEYDAAGEPVASAESVATTRYEIMVTENGQQFVDLIEATIPIEALARIGPGWTFQILSKWGPDSDLTGDNAGESQYRYDSACDPVQELSARE